MPFPLKPVSVNFGPNNSTTVTGPGGATTIPGTDIYKFGKQITTDGTDLLVDSKSILGDGKENSAAKGKKRSATSLDPSDITLPGESDDNIEYDMSCDVIRRKIRNLIDSGEVKVTHWQRELGINSNSYGRFMRLKGTWSGIDNQTYHKAYKFFKKRDIAGTKTLAKKRKSKDGTAAKSSGSSTSNAPLNLSDIHLDGEESDKVPVYDSCDEIRRKISAHLSKDGVTKANFCRALVSQYKRTERKIQAAQLNTFRQKHGPDAGNTSCIFYTSYVYFEKLRVKEGKAKTKHRQDMERAWSGNGGFDVERPGVSVTGLFLRTGETYTLNSLGEFTIHGRGR